MNWRSGRERVLGEGGVAKAGNVKPAIAAFQLDSNDDHQHNGRACNNWTSRMQKRMRTTRMKEELADSG